MAAPSSWRRSVAVLLMLLMCGSAGANFVVETSVLEIIQPVATNFSMAVANFGNPLYGGSLRCARALWRAVPVARVRVAGAHSTTPTARPAFGTGFSRARAPLWTHVQRRGAIQATGALRVLATAGASVPVRVRAVVEVSAPPNHNGTDVPCRLLLTFPGVTDVQTRYASSNVPGTPVIALVDRGGVWPVTIEMTRPASWVEPTCWGAARTPPRPLLTPTPACVFLLSQGRPTRLVCRSRARSRSKCSTHRMQALLRCAPPPRLPVLLPRSPPYISLRWMCYR